MFIVFFVYLVHLTLAHPIIGFPKGYLTILQRMCFLQYEIVKQKNIVVVHGEIRPPTDVIWQDIINKYCFKKSAKELHTLVAYNKWNVQVD